MEWQDIEDLDSAEEDSGDEEQSRSLKVHYARSLRPLSSQIWFPSLVLRGLCQISSVLMCIFNSSSSRYHLSRRKSRKENAENKRQNKR